MLTAKRKSDGQIATAYTERASNGPYLCVDCGEELLLKSGSKNASHFAHMNPIACKFFVGESDAHRLCKFEIFDALNLTENVSDVELERPLGSVRPDISASIGKIPVAIEIQISALSIETIMNRTIEYNRKGIYVLWLLPWSTELNQPQYSLSPWEKWLHAAYFGQIYFWAGGLSVVPYRFERIPRIIPRREWFSRDGKKNVSGSYVKFSARHKKPVRGQALDLVKDFVPRQRLWWEGGGITVPDAKILVAKNSTRQYFGISPLN